MPYEYEIHGHSAMTMNLADLKEWLDAMGAKGWRLVTFHPDIDTSIIFERKIEINETLRNAQLGIQPEPEPEPENES